MLPPPIRTKQHGRAYTATCVRGVKKMHCAAIFLVGRPVAAYWDLSKEGGRRLGSLTARPASHPAVDLEVHSQVSRKWSRSRGVRAQRDSAPRGAPAGNLLPLPGRPPSHGRHGGARKSFRSPEERDDGFREIFNASSSQVPAVS